MFADLHLHSQHSDGTFSTAEIAERARQQNLQGISLTDHDTVEGCADLAARCAAFGIEFIPGTELTVEYQGHEFHVLGYWIDVGHPFLRDALARFQAVRQNRIREIVFRLNQLGVLISAEIVFQIAGCRSPGRPHVARALVAQKFCKDYDEAFERFLKKGRPAWVPKQNLSARDAVDLVHAAGGVAVLAHPGLYHRDHLIPSLASMGLDGLECWHSKHPTAAAGHYDRMAAELNLAPTGGSDCHGMTKGQPLIGSVRIPYAHVENLRRRRPSTTRVPPSRDEPPGQGGGCTGGCPG